MDDIWNVPYENGSCMLFYNIKFNHRLTNCDLSHKIVT